MTSLQNRRPSSLFGLPEAAVLLAYAVFLAFLLPFHESWGDEVTAWLLSRDSSLGALFGHLLRAEGSPGLWHLLLWCFARLHLSFTAVHWACLLFALCGIYLLLRFCPFPRLVKLLLPFGFYLAYQYAVIARSYVLFPLLLFAVTALLCQPRSRPVLLAVVLGLLANISAHGAVYSLAITLVIAVSLWKQREIFPGVPLAAPARAWSRPVLILTLFWAAAVATAVPTHLHALNNLHGSEQSDASQSRPTAGTSASSTNSPALSAAAPQPDALREQPPSTSRLQNFVWLHTHAANNASHRQAVLARLLYAAVVFVSLVTYPVSTSNVLAVVFLLLLTCFLWQRKALILLLPYLALLLLCMLTQVKEHHTGLLWVAILAALWSAWRLPVVRARLSPEITKAALLASLSLVAVLQIGWTVHSAYNEKRLPYTGDVAAAHFLAALPPQTRVVSGRGAVAAEPPLYANHFYINSNPNTLDRQPPLAPLLLQHPDVVVIGDLLVGDQHLHNQWFTLKQVGASEISPAELQDLERMHYHQTNRFCGQSFMRAGYSHQLCQYIYRPTP